MILLRAAGRTGRIWLVPRGLHGVRPADFAVGDDDSPLVNDADLPGDADTQFLWWLRTPLLDATSNGTTTVTDAGAYTHTGADDGTWQQGYAWRALLADGSIESSVDVDAVIEFTIGSGSTITAAAGATTTSTLTGSSRAVATITQAAGVTTTSTLAGLGGASTISPAAGATTASTLTGSSVARSTISAAAGTSTASTLTGSATAPAITPAAGVTTTSTLTGRARAVASISPAAGSTSTQILVPVGAVTETAAVPSGGGSGRPSWAKPLKGKRDEAEVMLARQLEEDKMILGMVRDLYAAGSFEPLAYSS